MAIQTDFLLFNHFGADYALAIGNTRKARAFREPLIPTHEFDFVKPLEGSSDGKGKHRIEKFLLRTPKGGY